MTTPAMPTGAVLFEGPSQLDGSPIVCIATGIHGQSLNKKTGPMVQTWILPRDIAPDVAITTGEDAAVCGACPLRGIVAKLANGEQINRMRGCYVFVGQAPQRIWNCYKRGDYSLTDGYWLAGKQIRLGSYGDPCAIPLQMWRDVITVAAGWTGYTHQWRDDRFQDYRSMFMASVESIEQGEEARALGWRTFRVAVTGELPAGGEFHCPASAEEGYRETCDSCGSCNGVNRRPDRASVVIWPHGPPAAVKSFYRLVRGDSKHIEHRHALNEYDIEVIAVMKRIGRASAAQIAERVACGTQSVATRIWHLRQMGFVRRIARGLYETTEACQ
jgi:hypothetical protein